MIASRKPMSVFTTAPANETMSDSLASSPTNIPNSPLRKTTSRNSRFTAQGTSPSLVFRSASGSNLVSEGSPVRSVGSNSGLSFQSFSNNSDGDSAGTSPPFESVVPMLAAGADILVPMIDRPEDMAELLANPRNARLVNLLGSALGAEQYQKAFALWTEVPRCGGGQSQMGGRGSPTGMDDLEWLFKSRQLLVGGALNGDKVLWRQWCDMVGWDDNAPLPTSIAESTKKNSSNSLTSQDTIHEEEEE